MSNAETVFQELYEAQYDRMYRLCLGYSGDQAEAADLTQEVFVKAWQALSRFRGDSQLSTWLYRIAVNTCLSAKRKRRLDTQPLGEQVAVAAEDARSHEREAQIQRLYQLISELPEADRLAISLTLEQVPYAEIAAALGITENNLRVRIHRIKQRLANAFQHDHA